jgi:hypothetical protein
VEDPLFAGSRPPINRRPIGSLGFVLFFLGHEGLYVSQSVTCQP